MERRFWLKKWPLLYRVRGFRMKQRWKMEDHFGLTLRQWRQWRFGRKKRRNPFLKPGWEFPHIDRHGRPPKHPLFRQPKNPTDEIQN
jgi:hypothetical protein